MYEGLVGNKHNLTHGQSYSRIYNTYHSMKQRCYNSKNKNYYNYGGRGIKICEEWLNDFQAFYDWSMSHGYSDDLTIDRKDNDGDYCPENCRWSTHKQQSNNVRTNHLITYKGETLTLKQWSEVLNINYNTLSRRINGMQWSVERAFETPVQAHNRRVDSPYNRQYNLI